jgi:hypothetical protein
VSRAAEGTLRFAATTNTELGLMHSVILSEQRAFRAAFGEARCESKDLLFCSRAAAA